MSHGRERHHKNCPYCDEPMEYYPGMADDRDDAPMSGPEPNIFSCPECGHEEEA